MLISAILAAAAVCGAAVDCKTLASNSQEFTTRDCQLYCEKNKPLTAACQPEPIIRNPSDEIVPTGTCYSKKILGWSDYKDWTDRWEVLNVTTAYACQHRCQIAEDCVWFMWQMGNELGACALVPRQSATDIMNGKDCHVNVCASPEFQCDTCDGAVTNGCVWRSYYHITGPKVCQAEDTNKDFCAYDINQMPDTPMIDHPVEGSPTDDDTTTTLPPDSSDEGDDETKKDIGVALPLGILAGGGCICALGTAYTVLHKRRMRNNSSANTDSRLDDMGYDGSDVLPPEDPERPFWQ